MTEVIIVGVIMLVILLAILSVFIDVDFAASVHKKKGCWYKPLTWLDVKINIEKDDKNEG